jgi:hypothetical protein
VTVRAGLLNATPTSPELFAAHVSDVAVRIVYAQVVADAPFASDTLIENVPEAVGVPLTTPVELFSVRPSSEPVASA